MGYNNMFEYTSTHSIKVHGYDGYMGQKVWEGLQFFNINPFYGNIAVPLCIN